MCHLILTQLMVPKQKNQLEEISSSRIRDVLGVLRGETVVSLVSHSQILFASQSHLT